MYVDGANVNVFTGTVILRYQVIKHAGERTHSKHGCAYLWFDHDSTWGDPVQQRQTATSFLELSFSFLLEIVPSSLECAGQGIDTPLSETGRQQAELAGIYLKDVRFTNVFASDMLRARQTAEIIVKNSTHCSDLEIVLDPLLKERSFGLAEGGPVQCMKDMAEAAGQSCPDFTPPQGETPEQVNERIRSFLKSMFQRMAADHCSDGQPETDRRIPATPDVEEPPSGRHDDGVRDLAAHALVVGHGAYMRIAVRHLVEELNCAVPCGIKPSQVFSSCPNTGMSRFVITLRGGARGGSSLPMFTVSS
ncbi:hypothetical protein GJAV_G00270140 [Gymnothorax javanicus]|nr:hypothetical protein GJAV_G00270140 [Gymnothorax javanicus]